MSVGYNVNDGSMDFNSGTNLTSGIQDRCCTRWWRSRNGFERWMVIVVIFLSIVIVALSIAVGVLDQIAHPSEPDLAIVNPVDEVGNLFDHMEKQVGKASQLIEDTDIIFNQTLRRLERVRTILTDFDNATKREKRFVEDIMVLERFKRDANSSNHNTTTVSPIVKSTSLVNNSNASQNSNEAGGNTTEITTPQPPILKLNTTTSKPTTLSINDTRINTTISSAPTTVNSIVANLTAQLNETKYSLNSTLERLEEEIKELNNLTNIFNNQTRELNNVKDLLENKTLELSHLNKQLNETKEIVSQKDIQITNLTITINSTREKLKEINETLTNTTIRIKLLETYINETTGILIPVLEILERMDRPIDQTYDSLMEAKNLLTQVNNTLYKTYLPLKQREKNHNQTKHISEFIDELEFKLERIKINFEKMEVQSIAIKEPLKKVQAKFSADANNTQFITVMNETKFLFNESVVSMQTAETSLNDINNHLTRTVANMTQTLKMLAEIEEEVKTTMKVIPTSVTAPTLSMNTTTPLTNSNYTVNSNLTSHALKSSSTVLLPGTLEIFTLVISLVICHGY